MTKKHFVALAAVLADMKPADLAHNKQSYADGLRMGQIAQWKATAEAIAHFCQSQNAQFDRERFLATCGVK